MTTGNRYDVSPLGTGKNWVTETGGLDPFIRAIAHALVRNGHPKSSAIATAVAAVKHWAAGGGKVTAKTRAKAAAAVAHWEAQKLAAHATPNKRDMGPVTESGSSGSLVPRGPSPKEVAQVEHLLTRPHAFRGSDLTSCATCGKPVGDPIHQKGKPQPMRSDHVTPESVTEIERVLGRTVGQRHRGPGHAPVPTGHVAGNVHRRRVAQKAAFNADADTFEPQMAKVMRQVFAKQSKATVSRLGSQRGKRMLRAAEPPAGQPPEQGPSPDGGQIFDLAFWVGKTAELAQPVYEAMTQASRNRVRSQLGPNVESVDDTGTTAQVADLLRARANRMAQDVTQTTFAKLQDQLAEGAQAGEGIQQLAGRVRSVFDQASQSRAETIARTEVIGSLNQSAYTYASGLPQSVVGRKEWLAHRDTRTRPTHRMADGQTAPIGTPFHVGASLMQHPGDPQAPPDEVCNCRCSVAYLPAVSGLTLEEAA